jgi:hypothetical protein
MVSKPYKKNSGKRTKEYCRIAEQINTDLNISDLIFTKDSSFGAIPRSLDKIWITYDGRSLI